LKTGKAVYPTRFPVGKSTLTIPTFEEELAFIEGLNRSTGRAVGIYPEIKNPLWHRQQGGDLSRAALNVLAKFEFSSHTHRCWLQCFEFEEIKRLRGELGWQGRLVQLLARRGTNVDGTDYEYLQTPKGLAELANYVDGIGPEISCILYGTSPDDRMLTTLVAEAHQLGLVVHPYTVRADSLPRTVHSMEDLHDVLFRQARVDGIFTDFPDKTASFAHLKRDKGN